jgi:KRAB domain-containing zinc finger protein
MHPCSLQMAVHMRSHTGDKPYKCRMCDHRTAQKGNMRIHERRHTGDKPYPCPLCPFTAVSSSATATHMRAVHPEAVAAGALPPLPGGGRYQGRGARRRSVPIMVQGSIPVVPLRLGRPGPPGQSDAGVEPQAEPGTEAVGARALGCDSGPGVLPVDGRPGPAGVQASALLGLTATSGFQVETDHNWDRLGPP